MGQEQNCFSHSRCLSLAAIPSFLPGIWGTTQSLESLFQRTRVFLLLNSSSCCRCDWKVKQSITEGTEARSWMTWFLHPDDFCQIYVFTSVWQPLVKKKKKKKKKDCTQNKNLCINCFCSYYLTKKHTKHINLPSITQKVHVLIFLLSPFK